MPRTSLRMYLSSTVGVFLAADSAAGGRPVPAGFEPDVAGFFLPKSGMSAETALFQKTMGSHSLHSLSMVSIHGFHVVVCTRWLVGTALVRLGLVRTCLKYVGRLLCVPSLLLLAFTC